MTTGATTTAHVLPAQSFLNCRTLETVFFDSPDSSSVACCIIGLILSVSNDQHLLDFCNSF